MDACSEKIIKGKKRNFQVDLYLNTIKWQKRKMATKIFIPMPIPFPNWPSTINMKSRSGKINLMTYTEKETIYLRNSLHIAIYSSGERYKIIQKCHNIWLSI